MKKQHQHQMQQQRLGRLLTPLNEKLDEVTYTISGHSMWSNSQCKMADLKLEKIDRIKKTDIMEQKFALQFHCTLNINNQPFYVHFFFTHSQFRFSS